MNNLDALKQELLSQKEQIEKMSGYVKVVGNNPSPAEITAGIKTIPSTDLSMSTATESDVKQGKTFFSGNALLKTGTAVIDEETINHLFATNYSTITSEEPVYFSLPDNYKSVKRYMFYYNYNPINLTFNNSLLEIEEYAFYYAQNIVFRNFENLTSLKKIGDSAFAYTGGDGLSFQFNDALTRISSNAFFNAINDGAMIKTTKNLTYLGSYSFYQDKHKISCVLNIDEIGLTSFSSSIFYNIAFSNDLILPSTITSVGENFNMNGCFKSVYIPSKTITLKNNCFGSSSGSAVSNFYMKYAEFESETPPTFGTKVFAVQNLENGFKIYVPDNAVDAYKAVANLSPYIDVILPVSQKE